jgi:hypothetical protein
VRAISVLVVGVATTVVLALFVLGAYLSMSKPATVSQDAIEEVVGSASLLREIKTSSQGADSYGIVYLVIDPVGNNSGTIVEDECRRLRRHEWEDIGSEHSSDGLMVKCNTMKREHNAFSFSETLSSFLEAKEEAMPQEEFQELRRDFSNRDGLLIVEIHPREL